MDSSSISLGRYAPYNTVIHRMDARNKILCLILLMVAVFFSYNTWAMTFFMGLIILLLSIVLMIISKTSIKSLFASLKYMWFMILFLLLINVLIPPTGATEIAFKMWDFPIYWDSILQSIKIILRLVLMVALTMILTSTTKPLDLANGFEWFLTPLKIVKFPVAEVAMTISIALRFIPTLLDETGRIMKAQESRGIDFAHGGISSKFRGIIALIVPLFVSAFQRSEELANAMEARGYDPRAKRSKYRELHWATRDTISLIFITLFTAWVICSSVIPLDYFDMLHISLGILTK
jgi:energy-coupling factor transport system permease protein